MLIPTSVTSYASLAVPDTSYWCGTAAHYYINPPGIDTGTACVWGGNSNPFGNWSPYVAGANTDNSGNTFIKLGWNPIYLEPTTPFRNQMPNWGVKIDCPNGGCNGLPCSIDPSQNSVNQMVGSASNGAGGGAFCVVTVAKGSTANFVVFNTGGSQQNWQSVGGHGPGGNGGGPGQGGPGGQWGPGGQFFGQGGSSSSSSSSSTSPSTTSSPTTTRQWSAWSSTSTVSTEPETTTHTHQPLPSGQPYYSLFNHTTYVPPTAPSSQEPTATPSGPSTPALVTPGTGAASATQMSAITFVLALAISVANIL
jgi:hypothetical protein